MSDELPVWTRRLQAELAAHRSYLGRSGLLWTLSPSGGRRPIRGATLCRHSAATSHGGHLSGHVRVSHYLGGHVQTSGVQTCNSAWSCPHCSPNISTVRASEVAAAVRAADAAAYHAYFVTLTVRHTAADDLRSVFDAVRDCWAYTWSGRESDDFRQRWGHVGNVRSVEVTSGAGGWHPHVHALCWFRHPVDVGRLREFMFSRWSRKADKLGRYVSPDSYTDRYGRQRHAGVDVQNTSGDDADNLGDYVAKWGVSRELSAAWGKSGGTDARYSPLGLLMASANRDDWATRSWAEFERVVSGRHALRWSPRLRVQLAKLGTTSPADSVILDANVTDADASADSFRNPALLTGSVLVPPRTWNRLVRAGRTWEVGVRLERLAKIEETSLLVSALMAGSM